MLPGVHQLAEKNAEKCTDTNQQYMLPTGLTMVPVEFNCGLVADPQLDIADIGFIFCASSCMHDGVVEMASRAVGY